MKKFSSSKAVAGNVWPTKFWRNLVFIAALVSATPGLAQTAPNAPMRTQAGQGAPLTEAQINKVVDALVKQIEKTYVFPEKRQSIAKAIRAAQASFASLSAQELAARLSATLLAASNDKHLNVVFDPARSTSLSENPDPLDHAFFDEEGLRLNQGYVRQEILPGNVRYVRIQMFAWTDNVTASVIDAAAQFLSGGAAVIIDLRGNGGGHSIAVQRLISYLMPAKSRPLMTFYDARTGKSEVTMSVAKLPSARITGRPVYVLIDRASFSAAEEFAYHIQQFKLGKLVGEPTAGGANNNMFVSLPEGFIASVSFGRPIHPISKSNWEGVGITPDQASPGPAALDMALTEALTDLLQSPNAKIKAEASWELPAIKARNAPVNVDQAQLQALAGSYGDREIRFSDNQLTSQRTGAPPFDLTPMGGDLFAVAGMPDIRFQFVRGESGHVQLEVLFRDGNKQVAQRAQQ